MAAMYVRLAGLLVVKLEEWCFGKIKEVFSPRIGWHAATQHNSSKLRCLVLCATLGISKMKYLGLQVVKLQYNLPFQPLLPWMLTATVVTG